MAEYVQGLSERMSFSGEVPPEESVVQVDDLGKGLILLEDKPVEFTTDRAEKLLKLPEFIVQESEVDRTLRDSHVNYLLNAMRRGTFHPEWVQIITCICQEKNAGIAKGEEYRMNGQHTAWARIYMDKDWSCKVRWMKYEAKTIADMRRLYASIDRIAPRTFHNVLNSYLAGTDQFKNVSQDLVKRIASGFSFWIGAPSHYKVGRDPDEIAYKIQTQWVDLTQIVTAYLKNATTKEQHAILRRSPVIAALYETFQVLKIKAAEFWDPVRDGVGLISRNDPRLRLRNLLMTFALESRPGSQKRLITPEEMYRICVHAWNAWRRGDELSSLRGPTDSKRPKAK